LFYLYNSYLIEFSDLIYVHIIYLYFKAKSDFQI